VSAILMRQLDLTREQITPDATIIGDLGADSLDVVEITLLLEECYDITIADELLDQVGTVGDLCSEITALLERNKRSL
jgi:acyl carrier protein